MVRRRLSSDGFKLFNLAYPVPPSKIRQLLSCLFHTEYDDKLDTMTEKCKEASKQLYSYHADPLKKNTIIKCIDNSIFNVIYAILCKDGQFASAFQMKQNYRYFMDLMENAHKNGDHNTAIMLRSALDHHALKQMKFKLRQKDIEILKTMEEEYGTWRNCYKHHLKTVMDRFDMDILPSMMVLQMHVARHRAYSNLGRCKLHYGPTFIEGKIGLYAIQHITEVYNDVLPLYEDPPVKKSSDLILIAQQAK